MASLRPTQSRQDQVILEADGVGFEEQAITWIFDMRYIFVIGALLLMLYFSVPGIPCQAVTQQKVMLMFVTIFEEWFNHIEQNSRYFYRKPRPIARPSHIIT